MHGIVSILPSPFYEKVEDTRDELEKKFGLKGVKITPIPHFTWQIGRQYDFSNLDEVLMRIAKQTKPFAVRTFGVGIFTGEKPIFYIPVVRNPEILRMHSMIWSLIRTDEGEIFNYFDTSQWIPHISLALEDVTEENLPLVVGYLSLQNFNWEFVADNISMVGAPEGETSQLIDRYSLSE